MNYSTTIRSAFADYLESTNVEGSGKSASYLRALELLELMLRSNPLGFEDCRDIWAVASVERLMELRAQTLHEQKQNSSSPWVLDGIPVSYLRGGYCSAALTQFIEFLTQYIFTQKILSISEAESGDEAALAQAMNITPTVPDDFVYDSESKDGKERIQNIKARIGQRAFRELILGLYQNRCCLTGIELPEVNRASHIIGWAERADTRMDPRNGLCLSATYDAAFDRKLITFDDDYRLVLSKAIRERVPSQSLKSHFLSKEGQRLEMPTRFRPLKEYFEHHRQGGNF
jgi:putative restriction endonuclease